VNPSLQPSFLFIILVSSSITIIIIQMEPLHDPDPDEIIQSKVKNAQSSIFTLSDRLSD
jgi:hypothetical protein